MFVSTLGGPLIKDKLFWFVSAEFIGQSSFATSRATVPADVPGVFGSMVDACNAVGRANVNALNGQIAGLLPGSCIPQPASSTFENLFPEQLADQRHLGAPERICLAPERSEYQ